MSKHPSLPQELIDMIIDHLAGDKKALVCASLVCKSWVAVTWRHLFNRVSANCRWTEGPGGVISLFGSPIIHSTTNIRQYICELRLYSNSGLAQDHDFDIRSLVSTVLILPSLHTLLLESLYLPDSEEALQQPPQRVSLNRLSFRNTIGRRATLLRIINAFFSIENLQIINVNWHGYEPINDVEVPTDHPTSLNSLILNFGRLSGVHIAIVAPGLHQYCHSLRSLDITFPGVSSALGLDLTALCDLIKVAKSTLTDLRLDVSYTNLEQDYILSLAPPEHWDGVAHALSQCATLSTLHISLYVEIFPNIDPPLGESGPNPENALQWNTLTYLLSTPLTRLNSLIIVISSVDCYGDWRRFDFGVSQVDWPLLDKIILDQKSLRSVIFCHREIYGHGFGKREPHRQTSSSSVEQWKRVLEHRLPGLRSSGISRFALRVEDY